MKQRGACVNQRSRRNHPGGRRVSANMRNAVLSVVMATIIASSALAAEKDDYWPQWRGPLNTGASATAKPPTRWSETEAVKWKVKLPGSGSATPIVWGDNILIQTAIPSEKKVADYPTGITGLVPAAQEQGDQPRPRRGGGGGRPRSEKPTQPHEFVLLNIDRATGKVRWQKIARQEVPHEGHHEHHGFSSASPVTDGQHVFAYFGSRGLHAFDFQGNVKWSKDLGDMQTKMGFGEGSSPALHKDTIVINWDHEGEDFIVALDKHSGRELWRQAREEDTSWSTPLVIEHQGKSQVIVAATKKIRSYDLTSGGLIWECGGLTRNAIPTPVVGDGMVYLTSGFSGAALLAIKLGRTGDLTDTDAIAWKLQKSTPYVPSPLLYDNKLFFFSGNKGVLSCFDAREGKPLYEAERLEGFGDVYSSPVAADGRIYLFSRTGAGLVLKNSANAEVLAKNQLDDGIDASPALVGNELIVRGRQHLYCLTN